MRGIGLGTLCALIGIYLFGAHSPVGLIFLIGGFVSIFSGMQQRHEQKQLSAGRSFPSPLPGAVYPALPAGAMPASPCAGTELPAIPAPIPLQAGEFACFRARAFLSEARKLPRLNGGYMPWEAAADEGELYITNLRIFFSGSRETRDIPLDELSSVTAGPERIEIMRRGRSFPSVFMVSDPENLVFHIENARTTRPAPLPAAGANSQTLMRTPAPETIPSGEASLVRCPRCGSGNGYSANFCQNCAAPIGPVGTPTINYPGQRR